MKLTQDAQVMVDTAVDELAATLERNDASSRRIATMVQAIEEVAFQTNLLALRAAVESAQTGDTPAEYAAIAGDLRTLAESSARAAKDAAGLIEEALRDASMGNAEVLQASATQMAEAMKRNAEMGEKVTDLVDRIHAAGPDFGDAPPPPPIAAAAVRHIHLLKGTALPD
jgi:methyl-accepting chemotaxis protein